MDKPRLYITKGDLNGNIFNLITIAKTVLINHGQEANAKKMEEECIASGSYEQALEIVKTYVDVAE